LAKKTRGQKSRDTVPLNGARTLVWKIRTDLEKAGSLTFERKKNIEIVKNLSRLSVSLPVQYTHQCCKSKNACVIWIRDVPDTDFAKSRIPDIR
jgi:hypothetical protein